ncbi:hypothetical protein ACHAWO_008159 [Cyclotella atomus]|uniref:Peptidase S1 domain-containing protein n=1 Tax=Cyclotella atomus TaxID=382360 RepID=A0ABD3PMJ3_9STRA
MNLYKAFLSMVLIGMAFGEDIKMDEETNKGPEEIVNGKTLSVADRANRPWLVNVGWYDPDTGAENFACGGSVISPSAILLAAHCIRDSRDGTWFPPLWIDFFRYNKRHAVGTNGIVRTHLNIGDCVHHEGYQAWVDDDFSEDVAVCILPMPAPAGVTPITLNANPNVPASTGVPLDVAGWGLQREDNHDAPDPREEVPTNVPRVTTLDYNTPFDCPVATAATEMCTVTPAGSRLTATCHGDSGGPIVLGNGGPDGGMQTPVLQVGIVSHHGNPNNCLSRQGNIAIRTSAMLPWITNTVCVRTGFREMCPALPPPPPPPPVASKSSKNAKRMLRN